MKAYALLDEAFDDAVELLEAMEKFLGRKGMHGLAAELSTRTDRCVRKALTADLMHDREHPAQSAQWPAAVNTMYARPADVLAAQHTASAPGVCLACGTRASGQQLGGARKNHKTSVRCKYCGADVTI